MKRCVFTVALLAGVVSMASAQQGPMPMFNFDTDGDGAISEEEFNQAREQRMAARAAQMRQMYGQGDAPAFAELDADGDGMVSQQEMMDFHQARMQARWSSPPPGYGWPQARMGRPGFNRPAFADLDENGDGCINQAELEQFQQMRMGRMYGPRGQMPGRGAGYNMPRYQEFDLDADGVVTQEEFIEGRGQRIAQRAQEGRMMRGMSMMPSFEEIDTDKDGTISAEEFSAHQASHRQMMRGQPPQ